jgi:hypothetical protein
MRLLFILVWLIGVCIVLIPASNRKGEFIILSLLLQLHDLNFICTKEFFSEDGPDVLFPYSFVVPSAIEKSSI